MTPWKRDKLYLDTSVINFAVSIQDVAKEKQATLQLLDQIKQGKFEGFISGVVVDEIMKASSEKQQELFQIINGVHLEVLAMSEEVEQLAEKYISEGVIPRKHSDDALHIAIASVHGIDIIVSWNFEHLVKSKTRREVHGINSLMKYHSIDIATPLEVITDEGA